MRLLILSCNTGEGHNSAAKAIKEKFISRNSECDIKDALAFWSPEKSKLISKGHVFIYRKMPTLFGVGYRFEENHPPKNGDQSFIYELVTKGCDSLSVFLEENRYDAIICTHVFSAMMVTELRRRRKLSLPCYFVATDYTCSPGVNQTSMDAYFIPHEKLIPEFAENGIQTSKLVPSGIPVRDAFYHKTEKKEARRTLSLPEDKKTVLLMCGSMGCGPIKSLAEELPEHLSPNATLIVICGSNVKLFKLLTKKQPPENCRIIGFTNKMPLYMDAADLILTKPGGLSTSEAAVKALPMLFINAVPGCETRNIEFFLNNGCADMRDSDIELCDAVCEYLENPDKLDSISKTMAEEFSGNATECIYKYVLKDVERAYGRL